MVNIIQWKVSALEAFHIFKFVWRFHEFLLSRNFRAKIVSTLTRLVLTDFSSAKISVPNYFQSSGSPLAYPTRPTITP